MPTRVVVRVMIMTTDECGLYADGAPAIGFPGDDHARVAEVAEVGAVRIEGAPSHGRGDSPGGDVGASGSGREGLGYTVEAFPTPKRIVP
jgi:acyl-CoA reductase-like NAD-dependent aldehyde dehydrogenase